MVKIGLLRKNFSHSCRCVIYLVGLISSLVSIRAYADHYIGINALYSSSEYDNQSRHSSQSWQEASPLLVQAQIGYFFNDYLAVEARHATTMKRNSGLAIDRLSNIFIKANIPVTPRVAFYTLGGYSYINADLYTQSHHDTGFSFGVGLHYALSSSSALTTEWTNYLLGDEVRLNAFQFGIQFRF